MPTLYITEFATVGANSNGAQMSAALVPSLADQAIAIGAASVQSAAFQPGTRLVRIASDAACSVKFGANPAASVATMRLAAGIPEYFSVPFGDPSLRIAVIANS